MKNEDQKNFILDSLIDGIPDQEKNNLLKVMNDFLFNLSKKEMIQNLPSECLVALNHGIVCLTHISEPELELSKQTQEYQLIYSLLDSSKKDDSINDELKEIYKNKKLEILEWLSQKQNELKKIILNHQFINYENIKEENPEKAQIIFSDKLEKVNPKIKKLYNQIEWDLKNFELNPLTLKLDKTLFKFKVSDIDILTYAAFLIQNPKHQLSSFLSLDDSWNTFPLKWYANNQPMPIIKALLYYYKKGHDISEYFVEKYNGNDFSEILNLLESQYLSLPTSNILCLRIKIIKEILECYSTKLFSPSICASLSLIEGILWDFSVHIQKKEGGIYTDSGCNSVKSKNNKEISNITIGLLLKNTKYGSYFDEHFINYFCDEVYNERNPVLHGRELKAFTEKNAAKKIATIEYLLETINKYIKDDMLTKLDRRISDDTKNSIIASLKSLK